MIPLSSPVSCISENYGIVESPIEDILFTKMIRDLRFTFVKEKAAEIDDFSKLGEGMFIFTQEKVGNYRADMILRGYGYSTCRRIWPPDCKGIIAVECDGKHHNEQRKYDAERDEYFARKGIKTLRFTGAEIYRNPEFVIDQIEHELKQIMGAQ